MRTLTLLFLGLSLAACDEELAGPDLGPTVGPEFMGLIIEIVAPPDVETTQNVEFQIRLTNIGPEPFTMTDPQLDIYVLTRQGGVLWNWLNDKVIIGGVDAIIDPEDTYILDIDWDQTLNDGEGIGAGTYSVFAVFFFPQPPALVSQTQSVAIHD